MQVFKNAPVEDGDTDWVSVTVRINEDQIYVAQMMVNIGDNLNETIYSKVCIHTGAAGRLSAEVNNLVNYTKLSIWTSNSKT